MLYQLFNEFPISYIKIAKDHNSRESFGYAFVGFKSHSKAEEALIKLNYSKLGKKTLRISWYNREPNNYRNNPDFNIFVKKLPKNITHKEFHDHFSKYGNVVSARLVEDEEGEPVGYGFVLYDSADGAQAAVKEANGTEWKGKKLYAGTFIKNKPKRAPQFNNIYVKNIPKAWSKEDIIKFFSRYGELGSILIREPNADQLDPKLPEEKKKSILNHKFAFICFKEFDPAKKAVNQVPFYKLNDKSYNAEIDKLVDLLRKNGVEEDNLHKGAAFMIENVNDYKKLYDDQNLLTESIEAFRKHLKENDDVYIVKDKEDRLECCQALKKKDRIKKLKQLYERIKKQIKEKYRFCNLYIKNLPDNFDDEALRELFSKYGEIRSVKTVRKELFTSYLGIKRSVKVFGFVCFYDPANAREAKQALHGTTIGNNQKLFVDYHQSRQERAEYLKLKMINQSNKMFNKGMGKHPGEFPPMMRNMPGQMRPFNPQVFGPHMLRKFPPQTNFVKPNMMTPMQGIGMDLVLDKNTKRDFYGEKLYTKISSNPNFSQYADYFSKIVGIFLDLEDHIIERLINDDNYFNSQVIETIRLLNEKTGH